MKLVINGELTTIKNDIKAITIAIVIKQLGYHPQLIVVEFNGSIIDSNLWGSTKVKDGDSLEIVTIVGGGS